MDDQLSLGRERLVRPDGIDRIGIDRDQLRALVRKRLLRRLHPLAGVEPRIIANPRAIIGMFGQPFGDAGARHADIFPMIAIDLLAHLDGVAAIGEDRGFFRHHHGRARRTLKPGQPGQPLGIGADIFAHMFIGERHDKAGQFAAG